MNYTDVTTPVMSMPVKQMWVSNLIFDHNTNLIFVGWILYKNLQCIVTQSIYIRQKCFPLVCETSFTLCVYYDWLNCRTCILISCGGIQVLLLAWKGVMFSPSLGGV